MEGSETGRSLVGHGDWTGASGLAFGVLSHVDAGTRRNFRLARWRRRSHFSSPRERDRAIRVFHRKTFRTLLVSRALFAGGRREDVEEPGEFLHPARHGAERAQTIFHPISAGIGAIPQSAELHV